MDVLQTLAVAGFALAGAIGGLFLGSYAGRRAAGDVQFTLRADFDSLKTNCANLASQVRENMERSYQHAQRAAAHTSKEKARDDEPQWTLETYTSHLEKGGPVLPDVEKLLNIGV